MPIDQKRIEDASRAAAFADDVRAIYNIMKQMQFKIERYIAGTATGTDMVFVDLVNILIDPPDLARIGALKPQIDEFLATLEGGYTDLISPPTTPT